MIIKKIVENNCCVNIFLNRDDENIKIERVEERFLK